MYRNTLKMSLILFLVTLGAGHLTQAEEKKITCDDEFGICVGDTVDVRQFKGYTVKKIYPGGLFEVTRYDEARQHDDSGIELGTEFTAIRHSKGYKDPLNDPHSDVFQFTLSRSSDMYIDEETACGLKGSGRGPSSAYARLRDQAIHTCRIYSLDHCRIEIKDVQTERKMDERWMGLKSTEVYICTVKAFVRGTRPKPAEERAPVYFDSASDAHSSNAGSAQ